MCLVRVEVGFNRGVRRLDKIYNYLHCVVASWTTRKELSSITWLDNERSCRFDREQCRINVLSPA